MYDDEFELTFDLSDEDKASRAPAPEQEPVQEAAPEPAVLLEEPPQAVSRADAPATAMTCTNCLRVIFIVFFLPYLVLSCSTITANRL